jgi:hypothetical protein
MAGAEIMFNNPDSAYYVTTMTDIYLTDGATLTVGAKKRFPARRLLGVVRRFQVVLRRPGLFGCCDHGASVGESSQGTGIFTYKLLLSPRFPTLLLPANKLPEPTP